MALGTRSVVSPWGLVPCKRNRPCNGSANSLGHVCHPLYATDSISWSNHQVRARLASKALCNLRVKSSMVYPHWKCQIQSYQKISELLVDAPNRLSRPRSQEFRLSFLDQLRTQHSTNTVTNGKIRKWPNVVKDGSYSNRKQIDLSDGISNTTENSDVKNDATRLSDALCGVRQSYTRRKRVAATQVSRQTSMSISKQGMEVQRVNNYFTEGLHTLPSHDGLPLHEHFGILYEDITIPANGVSFKSDGVTKASWEEEKKFEYSPGNAWLRESAKIRKQLFTSEIKAVTKTLDLEDMDLHMEDISRQQKESHLNAPEPGSFIPRNEVAQPVKECQAKKKKSSKQRAVDMGVSGVKTIETKTTLQKSASKKTKDVFNETMISDCLNMVNEKCIDISITSEEAKTDEAYENKKVLIIEEVSMAEAVVKQLMEECRHLVHACDTEVSSIDVMKESPVNHGNLICFSIYCGPDVDFGNGKSRIWVDVLKGGEELLQVFKHYFENSSIRKVWHNYSFDKHILANYGIEASGFYADTMHLARLWDSARRGSKGGYSLEALTSDPVIINSSGLLDKQGKTSMKELFGQPNTKKDGSQGKLRVVPPVEELQETQRNKWIHYSAHDAVCTWHLWRSLQTKLEHTPWVGQGDGNSGTMYDFYVKYWAPFGSLLVQMEADGMLVDRDHLAKIEKVAIEQKDISTNRFRKWAARYCPDAVYMNVCSDAQIRQLLFGGISNRKDPSEIFPFERTFKVPNTENYIEKGAKTPKKQRSIVLAGIGVRIPVDSYTSSGWPAVGGASIKALAGKVAIDYTCLEDDEEDSGDISLDFSDSPVLLTSGGIENDGMAEAKVKDLSIYGKAYDVFGGGKEGEEACMAFAALCELTSIDTLISNFIQPLQGDKIAGQDGRVHCSLNINTETGRLSARRPNLQNQPALEKDRYKIRQAFVAAPGKSLIVADYGQLELRILAHLTNCKSMLEAFEAGGDFHSRTAMNMYPHVEKAVKDGTVLLEWDAKPGESTPPAPLLKDMFASERRKAKMLNFSIAYGKTAMGLANDWKVSKEEAQRTLELWYNDRIEVKNWQANTIKEARKTKHVYTLLGRSRHLPEIASQSGAQRGHAERAAINTPVQGSAADVAMCAMLEINKNPDLQKLGWKLILQVHDEVILEGPTESAQEAMHLVVDAMSHPFNGKNFLKVKLDVAAKYAESWYAAK